MVTNCKRRRCPTLLDSDGLYLPLSGLWGYCSPTCPFNATDRCHKKIRENPRKYHKLKPRFQAGTIFYVLDFKNVGHRPTLLEMGRGRAGGRAAPPPRQSQSCRTAGWTREVAVHSAVQQVQRVDTEGARAVLLPLQLPRHLVQPATHCQLITDAGGGLGIEEHDLVSRPSQFGVVLLQVRGVHGPG